jgi:hypothetical protein
MFFNHEVRKTQENMKPDKNFLIITCISMLLCITGLPSVNAQVQSSTYDNIPCEEKLTADVIPENSSNAISELSETIGSQRECLISLWNHRRNLDPTDLVRELGFNLIWSHDHPYTGQTWKETHMYSLLKIPGVKYVFAKIERSAWGWTHEQSLKHARWVAELSLEHIGILGLYLNDFYDEIEDGYRTEEQWREIITAARDINPKLQIWVPHYPHRNQGRHAFDFDIDGVILNLWGNDPELMARAEEHIAAGLKHHPDKPVIAGLYLRSGPDGGRWLTESEFKTVLGHYVELVNAGKLAGLRVFSAGQFEERPEYKEWAKEVLSGLKCL